jgi:ABC-type nitrate/sulfonate/bicarbonate transport system permease component
VKTILPYLVSAFILAGTAALASSLLGSELVPPPDATLAALWKLARSGELFQELAVTLLRGVCGILLANIVGIPLGLAAGLRPGALRLVAPLVAALQSCPPVVWITLVMVWAGTGSIVPVVTVFAATLPFVFSSTAQGAMGIDRRIAAMSRLYDVPQGRRFRYFVLPGVFPFWLAGFSTVLATGWKSAAVAEFLGSHQGIGACIFWSYHKLNMESLNAWALSLILLGMILECAVITPLRRKASHLQARGINNA